MEVLHQKSSSRLRLFFTLFSLGLSSIGLHLIPFLLWGSHPFGYDTGFYRRFLTQPFTSFPNAPVPGLGTDAFVPRLLLDTFRLLHIPVDIILYGSYTLLFALIPILLFIFLKDRLGYRGAFFGAILLILSPISYNFYWFMFWKNALALCVLLLIFICIERTWFKRLFALDIILAFTHKTTTILYMVTLLSLAIFSPRRWKEIVIHLLVTGASLLFVGFSSLHGVLNASPIAIFVDIQTFAGLSIPLLLLIAVGFRGLNPTKLSFVALAFFVASFLFPIMQIPFYERIFIFCDVALVILAAYALEYILSRIDVHALTRMSLFYVATLCATSGLLFGSLFDQVRALQPLMTDENIARIEYLGKQISHDATILTTSDEAPWYEGWTLSHIAAPGMLRDNHNLEEWMAFWTATSSEEKAAFLNSLPQPLYISTLGNFEDLLGSTTIPCLKELAPQLLLNECIVR